MGKLFKKIGAITLGAVMALGVGLSIGGANKVNNVVSADEVTFTLSGNGELTSSSTTEVLWTSGKVTLKNEKNTASTAANNYIGGVNSRTSTRTYNGQRLTIDAGTGNIISSLVFTTTSTSYASSLGTAARWTGATTEVSSTTVTVTATGSSQSLVYNGTATVGMTKLIVTYSAASTKVLDSIAITTPPTKTSYFAGQTFDKTGMVVTATYDDASTKEVTTYTLSPDETTPLTQADTFVTVSYTEGAVTKTAAQTITVAARTLTSVALSGDMTTKTYEQNSPWNPAGLVVTASYDNGDVEVVTDSATWAYDPATTADTSTTSVSVTASYGGLTSAAQVVTGITINAYTPIGGIISGHKYLITATSNNGNTYVLKAGTFAAGSSSTFTEVYTQLSDYSAADAWTFTSTGTKDNWLIGTDGETPSYIHHTSTNNGVVSAAAGQGTFVASYANQATNKIYLNSNGRYLTVYGVAPDWRCYTSTTTQGVSSQITLVEYVDVEVSSIAVTTQPTKTEYHQNDSLDTTGIVVTATYSDSSTKDVTSECSYSPTTLSTVGTQAITVTHTSSGKTTTFNVTVLAPATIVSIAVTTLPTKVVYNVNETLDVTGIVVTGTYSDSTTLPVTIDCTYSPTALTTAGTQSITVTHTPSSLTTNFNVTVNEVKVYTLVTDVASLSINSEIVIASSSTNFAMSTTQNANNRGAITITKDTVNNTISDVYADLGKFTLKQGVTNTSYYAFQDAVSTTNSYGGYLACASSSSNIMHTDTAMSVNSEFEISITPEGVATVTATGSSYTRNTMKKNSSSALFSCYASGQTSVALYQYVPAVNPEALAWASDFLTTMTCDATGTVAPDVDTWLLLGDTFLDLPTEAQTYLTNAHPSVEGDNIQKAVARYDYIIVKYNNGSTTDPYLDYMERNPVSATKTGGLNLQFNSTNIAITIISITVLASVTTLGIYLFLNKKRKNNNVSK